MFKCFKKVLQHRRSSLEMEKGLLECSVLSMLEDFLKQNKFFFCFPESFKNKELTIVCAKPIVAQDLADHKEKITIFLKKEFPKIEIASVLIKISYK